uniref:Glycosyltransferase family 92 protein n=1 Tax=Latimeria chalumnae TaxID=7897 RepID=H3A4W8_LATCH
IMPGDNRKWCVRITVFLTLFTLLILYFLSHHLRNATNKWIFQENLNGCNVTFQTQTITSLNKKTFIISAYFDNRERKITRFIAIIDRKGYGNLYCRYCCKQNDVSYTIDFGVEVYVHSDHFGFPYATADLICKIPQNCTKNFVKVYGLESKGKNLLLPAFKIHNSDLQFKYEFSVCISTLFGNYNNVLQFIQAIEMYRLLGVGKVVIYKTNCSVMLEKVLKYYVNENVVEVIPWPITSHLKVSSGWLYSASPGDIHYYGQLTALNDCIYRHMYDSRYLLLNDIDEIALPIKHKNWHELMDSLSKQHPNIGVFLIENHIFPYTVHSDNNSFNIAYWNAVPGINILKHIHREPDRRSVYNPTKMIVNPRKVVQTSVHSVLHAYSSSYRVSPNTALLYHCRVPLQSHLPKTSLIEDTTLWRYSAPLIMNVNTVINKSMI